MSPRKLEYSPSKSKTTKISLVTNSPERLVKRSNENSFLSFTDKPKSTIGTTPSKYWNEPAIKKEYNELTVVKSESTTGDLPMALKSKQSKPPNKNCRVTKVKEEFDSKKESSYDVNNTTAAELLHDPNDLTIDDRPILTNAKTLADAIRKPSRKNLKKENINNGKLKKEGQPNQMDIFSQLSRAKKKTKTNKGEIIIID